MVAKQVASLSNKELLWFIIRLLVAFLAVFACSLVSAVPSSHRGEGKNRSHPGVFSVFEKDRSSALLKLPVNTPPQLRGAAEEFSRQVESMGGESISIVTEQEDLASIRPVIEFDEGHGFPPSPFISDRGDDRFVLEVSSRVLTIRANDPLGWEFGLYTLLDHFGGVRWFWPGADGTYTPERANWRIPYGTYEFQPAYFSRRLTVGRSEEAETWTRRNRLRGSYSYSHNLRRIFDREFFLANPETLAVDWDPQNSPGQGHPLWRSQPDLTSDLVVETAARAAIEAFQESPDRLTFSLGINDNNHYGDNEQIRELTRPMRYFRDLPDYSDLVFDFMNRVAEVVSLEFPDRFLGCLSYMWVENVPSFPVHPMILPYLTADRSQGYDVDFTEEDRELVREWVSAGPRLVGIYDYLHSAPNPFPRRANLIVGQRIRDAYETGVRAYFGEVNAIWPFHGDVPWSVARMLWDPTLDPGELEEEFLVKFFGPAAQKMGEFYDRARWIWMSQGGSAVWIKFYKDEGGIALFDEDDISAMTEMLDQALVDSGEGVYKTRVDAVRTTWELTLAFFRMQKAREELVLDERQSLTPIEIVEFLNARAKWMAVLESLRQGVWTRETVRTVFSQSDPTFHAARKIVSQLSPEERLRFWDWLFAESSRLDDSTARFIFGLARSASDDNWESLEKTENLREDLGEIETLGNENWELSLSEPWKLLISPSERVEVSYKGDGKQEYLRFLNAYAIGLAREFPVERGQVFEGIVRVGAKTSLGNRTSFYFEWKAEDGRPLGTTRALRLPETELNTEGTFHVFGVPPKGSTEGALVLSAVRQAPGDTLDVYSVEIRRFVED
ncbi:MAG: DUF4838 domain-containing protein [Verrucomicrobiota bacterium]